MTVITLTTMIVIIVIILIMMIIVIRGLWMLRQIMGWITLVTEIEMIAALEIIKLDTGKEK